LCSDLVACEKSILTLASATVPLTVAFSGGAATDRLASDVLRLEEGELLA